MEQNSTLVLKAHIDANYKVVGEFTPVTSKNVTLYKVVVSYPDGAKDYVFTIGAKNTTFTDWHAKQNMVNTYTISAILEDGSAITSNSIKIVMGANGEVTTEDALTSVKSSSTTTKDDDSDEKSEAMKKMKRDDDEGKTNVSIYKTQAKTSLLSQKTKELLNAKLDTVPVENRTVVYGKIITKIDTLVAKYKETTSAKNERLINLLHEVKSIIQEKLDSAGDDSIIQDILSE